MDELSSLVLGIVARISAREEGFGQLSLSAMGHFSIPGQAHQPNRGRYRDRHRVSKGRATKSSRP